MRTAPFLLPNGLRAAVVVCLLIAVATLGAKCNKQQPILRIVGPLDGSVLEACEVELLIHAKGTAVISTLEADLNGTIIPLEVAAPGATLFVATVDVGPGSPLLASNTLTANVEDGMGGMTTVVHTFDFSAAEPRAYQITDAADLITGPQGDSRVDDWLIENCQARFIVQNAPQRDLTGIGQYGGNLIDMELRGQPGVDNFMEIQPMLNIETVSNSDIVEVVNDGLDGNPAILRSCGDDDPIDYINANSLVDDLLGPGSFPAAANDVDHPIRGCTEFILAASDRFLEMTTTVTNTDMTGPGVPLFIGDYLNGSGELEQWTSEPFGAVASSSNPSGLTSGIGEMFVTFGLGVFNFFGFNEAEGVDYSYIPISVPNPSNFESSSFSTSGVSAVLHSNNVFLVLFFGAPPVFTVPANGGSSSFTRFINVGDGSAANAIDLEMDLRSIDFGTVHGCVTIGGVPAPGARVAAGLVAVPPGQTDPVIENLRNHWVTDADGCYSGRLPVGTWGVAAARQGTPYEGGVGSPLPVYNNVVMASGGDVTVDIALPATGGVQVLALDEGSNPIPARVGVVGLDPSPEVINTYNGLPGLTVESSTFFDGTKDAIPDGLVWVAYTDKNGVTSFDLEPGTYDVWVTRGSEYSAYSETVVVPAAPAPAVQVNAQIGRVIDTTGFVSSDFHVHMIKSSDSSISNRRRVAQFAGEGVDNLVATDHDRHTDLLPYITELGLGPWLTTTVGEEITTFDYGHFNAYPLGIDPDRITQGSTDWAVPAGLGLGFPTSVPPAYTALPSEIDDLVSTTTKVAGGILNDSPEVAVQINHIDSHFSPLRIDTGATPIASAMTATEKTARRFDMATPGVDFFHEFDALEIWNGFTRGHQSEFLDDRIGIWMNLLNQGIPTTAIFDTDTHDFFTTRSGGARSWTPSATDTPALIDPDDVGAAVKTGRLVGGQGIYVQTRLIATTTPTTQADFGLGGTTLITVPDGQVTLEIDIQAPTWAEYDTVEIYHNAATTITATNPETDPIDPLTGTPVLYTAAPDVVLVDGVDFNRGAAVTVHAGVPGADRYETTIVQNFTVTVDTWFVVLVKGSDGVSASMFPVMPANMGSGGVLALGATNALYVDKNENGTFDAPGVNCTNCL